MSANPKRAAVLEAMFQTDTERDGDNVPEYRRAFERLPALSSSG